MNNRIKQILAYILMITIIMGNTVSASAAGAGSVSFNGYEKNSVVEVSPEEKSVEESLTEESMPEDATVEMPEAESSTETMSEETAEPEPEETTGATTEEVTPEATTEAVTEEVATEEANEATTEEVTTEEATEENTTQEEDTTEETSEMLSLEAMDALEADSEDAENVYLYSSAEKDGEYVQEGIFASLQDALDAIEILATAERFYRIEMVSAQEEVVTSGQKTLNMPKQTAGIMITGGPDLTEPLVYFKGTLNLKTDVTFKDIIFVPTGNTAFSLGSYELTLDGCRVDDRNGGVVSGVSGSGIKAASGLILDDTDLRVYGAVNNIGTVVFAGNESGVTDVSSLTADGKISIGNVELETDGCLTGTAAVTRKNGMITKITPQITIGGEVYSTGDRVLYLDLIEKKDGTYQQLDLDKEEAADALKKGISFAKAQQVTYPHIKAAQRNEAEELVKAGGYLKYFSNGYGVILSYVESDVEQSVPCYTFADAVTEINNRKLKQDYVITLTEDNAAISGARQDILNVVPAALKMPDKKYVNSLVIQADPEAKEKIVLGFTGNITFTSDTTLRDINFVQMVKSGLKYVTADMAKDGFAAAVTVKTGGFDLTIEEKITFNTPLVLNGGNKGDLIIKERAYIHTLTNDYEPGKNSRDTVIFGMVTGVDELHVSGQDMTLNEYRNSRTGTKYTSSANKMNSLTLTDSVFVINGTNKEGSLTVKNLYIDNAEVLVGGKAALTNVTLEGSQKALISADTVFNITGTLTSRSNNAALLTRLKGSGKAPYLNISGKVIREKDILPVYVGVYPENKASEKSRSRAVELKDAPKVTAQLLTAKNALAVDFRPIAENYPWGSGEYNKDNTSGYMMMKSGNNIYVYEGSKVKIAVYAKEEAELEGENGELFGYFSSIKTATDAVNKAKNKKAIYTYVLMEANGTEASPVTITLPTQAKQVIVKSYTGSSEAIKTITFNGGIALGTETVFENIVLNPVKKGKKTTFTLSAKSKSLTLKNVDIPGNISKAADLTVQDDCEVTGNVDATDLCLLSKADGSASVLYVGGSIKVINLENKGESANVLEYTRTSKNVTQLIINGQILNEHPDKPVILRQEHTKGIPVLVKDGTKVTLKDAHKLAVMPKASTDCFVLEAEAADAEGVAVSAEYLRAVKAEKGIYQIDIRDSRIAEYGVVLESVTDSGVTRTHCLDYNQAVAEINNRADKTAHYSIYLGMDETGTIDVNMTDKNKYSSFVMPKKNTKASLIILPGGEKPVTVPFTGNMTGYGVITLKDIVLQPVKGAANAAPANTIVTLNADTTGASLHLNGVTTMEQQMAAQTNYGYIDSMKGTKNKTDVTLENCGDMLLTAGVNNVKILSLKDTRLLSGKNSVVTELAMDNYSGWISLGNLTITDVAAPEGITEAYVGVKQDAKKRPQLTVNGSVKSGTLLVRLYETGASVSDGMALFETEQKKEIESYLNEALALAKNADAAGFRAYAYRIVDMNGTVAENTDGVTKSNFASYKDGNYVKNGTQDAMLAAFGSEELKQLTTQAETELEKIAREKELYALIYLTDSYDVKEEAGHESKTVAALSSAHTVQILGMKAEWTYEPRWEEYIPTIWYYVQFYVGEVLYKGYVEESFLAYSDELLLEWKNDWSMLFPLENTMFAMANAASYSDVNQFPISYQGALEKLKEDHPNWTFVPMNVGRDWDDCVDEQMGDYSWIYYNQPAEFRGAQINSTWYYASRAGIEYYMDPRNFLTESNIFQFEQNTYNASYHTQSALQSFLNGTFMAGKVPDDSQGRTYANVIWNSGKTRGLSPFNLAARVIQEQGKNGTSAMISGTYSGYEGYYNHYNISASGTTNAEVIRNGLAYAKKMGWNTRVKSLEGGAAFIGNGYILQGQDTLYLQKFDVNHGSSALHQYMQNIMAPYSEGRSMKSMYTDAGSLNSSFVFKIPVFDNMSQEYSLSPTSVRLKKGKTKQLKVTCGGTVITTDKLTFVSDNPAVATVSENGLITAVGTGNTNGETGKATITVGIKDFDKKLKCKVEVYSPLESISLSIDEENLYLLDALLEKVPVLEDGVTKYIDKEDCPAQTTLNVTYDPADTTDNKIVTWTVKDPDIVEVMQDTSDVGKAVVTAKKSGTTEITAKVGKHTATVDVTVRVPMTEAYLKLDESSIALYKGEKTRVNVFYAPYETTDFIEPVWTSSNEEVAKVVDGDIVAVGKGNATLYANVGPFVGAQADVEGLSCQITVKEYSVTFMNPDGSVLLTATGEYGSGLENLTASDEIPWQQEKEGFIFAGWYTEENGNGYAVNEQTLLYGDMVLYPYFIDTATGFYAKPVGCLNYTGAYLKPDVEVYSGEILLTRGEDYTVVYVNNKMVNDPSDLQLRPTAIIYGRGAYGGSQYRAYFDIVPKDIAHPDVTAGNLLNAYNGKEQQMEPVLYDGGRTLQKDIDYTLAYPENDKESGAYSEAGSYEVLVSGIGNYSGSRVLTVTLSKRILMSKVTVGNIADMKFNNGKDYSAENEITDCVPAELKVTYDGMKLVENVDYTLRYEDNRQIGTAKVILTGIGNYIGTKIQTFHITGTDLSTVTVKGITGVDYTGETAVPDTSKIRISNKKGVLLREGLDYELFYQERTDAGRAYITITGINGYTRTLKRTYMVAAYDIAQNKQVYQVEGEEGAVIEKPAFEIIMDEESVEYDKAGAKKAVSVFFKGKALAEGKDYMLSYVNGNVLTSEGTPMVKVTGIGNFTGSVSRTFSVIEKDLTKVTMRAKDIVFRNRKGFCFVEPLLTDASGRNLGAGKDYEKELIYTYETDTTLYNGEQRRAGEVVLEDDIPSAGSLIRVKAVGKGNYTGSISCTFKVVENNSWLEILSQIF